MGTEYLIDTNAVIDYLDDKLPDKGNNLIDGISTHISVITRIELLAWPYANERQTQILKIRRSKKAGVISSGFKSTLIKNSNQLNVSFVLTCQKYNEIGPKERRITANVCDSIYKIFLSIIPLPLLFSNR
ncbi:MAG: hypothetical protein U5L09_00045 [Bacteroidales bacterium]|nr:hypothetical protein [Bacteroidales bacterium]